MYRQLYHKRLEARKLNNLSSEREVRASGSSYSSVQQRMAQAATPIPAPAEPTKIDVIVSDIASGASESSHSDGRQSPQTGSETVSLSREFEPYEIIYPIFDVDGISFIENLPIREPSHPADARATPPSTASTASMGLENDDDYVMVPSPPTP